VYPVVVARSSSSLDDGVTTTVVWHDTESYRDDHSWPGSGLDESEACLAQIEGYLDALRAGKAPPALERITILDRDDSRVTRLRQTVEKRLKQVGGATGEIAYSLGVAVGVTTADAPPSSNDAEGVELTLPRIHPGDAQATHSPTAHVDA
jgi:hypothetical protein